MALSHDFREKVIILGLTAVITGLLIPYILKSVEQNRAIEHKRLEAEI
jgi:hypothetical protein